MRGVRVGWLLLAAAFAGCDKPPAAPAPAPASVAVKESLPESTPRDAWEARRRAWLSGDAKAVWESLCAASREEKLRTQERAMDDMRRLEDDSLARALKPYGLEPSKFRRMTAVCTIGSPDGSSDTLVLVAERGSWKVDDAATSMRRGGAKR